ncbi:hypothetical protein A1Q1_03588 [Trichosporon asahii var. asahii CBS 2479]|uniref:Uncharacterized protein n=1 Tax=Trichosporon asahii var. asahii (strain ATCC 90039 / CBS 2479 / JCM 2466 / KCTC 7840 / NBRC 103889/ NCYC 2677 / UAMH 7654) TaxID=1186058 RepID=J6EXL9_TRIAS|nr:hypothetical protein A1Q1_03588 [Trichosporon asahii var. asahii CBS 2479]EJT47567.1 hypothetical protein A1Q1_03588 [Trichosporon asahii var. asahii CBS 2479]
MSSSNGSDEFDEIIYPRDEYPSWAQTTYYYPGLLQSHSREYRILFAAQCASRKVARAMTLDGAGFRNHVDEHDYALSIVDIILQRIEEERDECLTTRRPCTKTVASWRSWVRDTAYYVDDEVLEKHVPGVAKVLDGWNRTARADFVLACADQHWCTTDSVEINNGRIAWDNYAAIVESYQPGEVEKSRLYSITTFDPATFTSTCQFVTWDGREVPDPTAMPCAFPGRSGQDSARPAWTGCRRPPNRLSLV